jgi:hypothetical protein
MLRFKTVGQFHGGVVLNLQPLGQKSNGGRLPGGKRLDRKKSLVLMRFNTGLSRGGFAEIQKASNLVAEICQRTVIALPYGGACHHADYYIVIRCYLKMTAALIRGTFTSTAHRS